MTHPLVISYYTPNTHYEKHAARLARSLDRLGLRHRIEPRERKANWLENCAQKASFVADMRRATNEPLLWVDADAVMRKPLDILEVNNFDFAVVRRNGWSFFAGQIYFGASETARNLVERWESYCLEFPHVWDQVSLGYAWWDIACREPVSALWLPNSVHAKQKPGRPLSYTLWRSEASIVHLLESRRSRGLNKDVRDIEFSTKHIPQWWRDAAINERPFELTGGQKWELGLRPQTDN